MTREAGRARLVARVAGAALVAGSVLALAGCAASSDPPPIRIGTTCERCSMAITDLHFACERRVGRIWRRFDSIECLIADGGAAVPGAWLADYDRATLRDAATMWVVQGRFPSPMGGGFAAFFSRATADSVAAATGGRVDRLAAFAGEAP